MHRPEHEDEDEAGSDEPTKKSAEPQQPGPPKNESDDSPNPLPNDPSECGADGGDPGRT
jgi:hypothetical protein